MNMEQKQFDSGILILMNIRIEKLNEVIINLKKIIEKRYYHPRFLIAGRYTNSDIDALLQNLDYFKSYPIDAFIVQDLGIVPILQKEFPNTQLHVSTQASCINREAVKMYQKLGFSRVVLGREASLAEIGEKYDLENRTLVRMKDEGFVEGQVRITPR